MGRLTGMILWRFKKDNREFRFGYICSFNGDMVQIGSYNGASHGIWVKESEIEWQRYKN